MNRLKKLSVCHKLDIFNPNKELNFKYRIPIYCSVNSADIKTNLKVWKWIHWNWLPEKFKLTFYETKPLNLKIKNLKSEFMFWYCSHGNKDLKIIY